MYLVWKANPEAETLLCFTFDCLCTTMHLSWLSASQLPEIQSLGNGTFFHKIKNRQAPTPAYKLFFLWTRELLFAHFKQTLNVPSTAWESTGSRELNIPAQLTGNNHQQNSLKWQSSVLYRNMICLLYMENNGFKFRVERKGSITIHGFWIVLLCKLL